MEQLPLKLPLDLMQNRWTSILNPILRLPLLYGVKLKDITLTNGVPLPINHLLSRTPQGWFITDINADANVWRVFPFTKSTLTLQSNADVTISLWVY